MSSNNSAPDIITKPQFIALKHHFNKVLDKIKDDETLMEFSIDFSKLFRAFQNCFQECERRACKIRELTVSSKIEIQKIENVSSIHSEKLNHSKEVMKSLVADLDFLKNQQEENMEELRRLKNDVQNKDKHIQVNNESLEKFRETGTEKLQQEKVSPDKLLRIDPVLKQAVDDEDGKDIVDSKVLASDLKILTADLKFTRKRIKSLRKELENKEDVISEYSKDLSETEKKILYEKKKNLEKQGSMKMALELCRKELEEEKEKYQEVHDRLVFALDVNGQLAKDVEAKESLIVRMKSKIEEMELQRESAIRKSNYFENHLAKSHIQIKDLTEEANILKEDLALLQLIATKQDSETIRIEKEKKEHSEAQEMNIENLKHQVALRDKRLLEVVQELKENLGTLKNAKEEAYMRKKETAALESEVRRLKKALKERCSDVKELKCELYDTKRKFNDVAKEVNSQALENHSIEEKRNKYYSMYTHMKQVNSELKKENQILDKRQQYLVKILREKDMEIERVVRWKRFIN